MSSYTGLSPKGPNHYVGPNVYLPSLVTRTRSPTGADYRQPETGKLYPTGSYWLTGINPTTGTEGDLWYLSKITANVAYWLMLSSGGSGPVVNFNVQSATAPGVDPVTPTGAGTVTINGAVVANHSVVLETHTRALNTYNVEVQYAAAAAATDGTKSGVSHFNSAQFSVDASGFVSLTGGGAAVDSIGVDATSGTGTNPVLPTIAGLITVNGALVAAGTNPIRSVSTAPSVYQIQLQTSQALAAADSTKVGASNYNSAQFSVSAEGFVSLVGGAGPAFTRIVRQVFTATDTYTPTSGMLYADIEVIGGGGGGGGCSNAGGAGQGGAAGGGGGGGYARGLFDAATIGASQAVTIGAAGSGGALGSNPGTSGGTTSVGALISATGGSGGSGSGSNPNAQLTGGGPGGAGSNGDFQASGDPGLWGLVILAGVNAAGGHGGSSFLAGGGSGSPGGAGGAGQSFGAGGGGAAAISSGSGGAGGAGKAGLVIVTEYCS